MVSIHQSDADADQNKTRFVEVWICIFDGAGGGRQGFIDRGFWTKLGMDYGF